MMFKVSSGGNDQVSGVLGGALGGDIVGGNDFSETGGHSLFLPGGTGDGLLFREYFSSQFCFFLKPIILSAVRDLV
jgi:hypothetical protein